MHEAWYAENMEFLSMPMANLGKRSVAEVSTMISLSKFSRSETLGLGFFILLGLLIGLMLSCRLIQGSVIVSAFPDWVYQDNSHQERV